MFLTQALVLSLLGAEPDLSQPVWLSADESFKQFLPGPFAELVQTPDTVELQRIVSLPAPIKEPRPAVPRYAASFKKRVEGATRWRVLSLVADPNAAIALNHARCAPDRCEPELKLCGGFQPSVAVVLEKGVRRVRILVCFSCGEVWYERFESGKAVGVEKGEFNRERWWATIAVLLPGDRW